MRRLRCRSMIGAVVMSVLAGACSGDDDDTSATSSSAVASTGPATTTLAGITEAEAIDAARRAIADDDPGFDFDATRPHVAETDDTYDVSFVPIDLTGPGGEPHAVVDRATGEVLELYKTR